MTNETSPSFAMTNNLKRSFESAVRDIYQIGLTGRPSPHRTPIARRRNIAEPNGNAEKRALSDAARALAQLWKVARDPGR